MFKDGLRKRWERSGVGEEIEGFGAMLLIVLWRKHIMLFSLTMKNYALNTEIKAVGLIYS